MVRYLIPLLIITACFQTGTAQDNILFLDQNFRECQKKDAVFRMETNRSTDTIYKTVFQKNTKVVVAEFRSPVLNPEAVWQKQNYANGKPLHEGLFINKQKEGKWVYYSDWGKPLYVKHYVHNMENGLRIRYYISGTIKEEQEYVDGQPNGHYRSFDYSGYLTREGEFIEKKLEGPQRYYGDSGLLTSIKSYRNGIHEGIDTVFLQKKPYKVLFVVNDKVIRDSVLDPSLSIYEKPTVSPEKTPFVSVEQMPQFPGGEAAMMKFISTRMVYPEVAKDAGIEGKVYVKFTVGKDGDIRDLDIISEPLGYGMDKAAYDVIASMPEWSPGRQNGKPVSVYYNIPIRFRLF